MIKWSNIGQNKNRVRLIVCYSYYDNGLINSLGAISYSLWLIPFPVGMSDYDDQEWTTPKHCTRKISPRVSEIRQCSENRTGG